MTTNHTRQKRRRFGASAALLVAAGAVSVFNPVAPAAHAAIPPQIFTIQQVSSGRCLDAWNDGTHDHDVVTRPCQGDSSQEWLVSFDDSGAAMATLQQVSSGRFMDAHEIESLDYRAVSRPGGQTDNTQTWQVHSIGGGSYNIIQQSSGRLLDAHEIAEKDFECVTRPGGQTDHTQEWRLNFVRNA
jgi:hypothetical protein